MLPPSHPCLDYTRIQIETTTQPPAKTQPAQIFQEFGAPHRDCPLTHRRTAAEAKLAVLREALGVLREQGPTQERTVALLELFARA